MAFSVTVADTDAPAAGVDDEDNVTAFTALAVAVVVAVGVVALLFAGERGKEADGELPQAAETSSAAIVNANNE